MSSPVDSYISNLAANAALSQSGKLGDKSSLLNLPADKKLRKAAGEFESLLLSSLWKSMKSTFAAPEDDSNDPAHDTLEDWGISAMAGAVGKAGGLGIGKLIIKYLEPKLLQSQEARTSNSSKVSASPADTSH